MQNTKRNYCGITYDKSVGGTLRRALLVPRKRHREVSNILGANKRNENDNRQHRN